MSSDRDNILEVTNLVKYFPVKGEAGAAVHAVDDVTFSVRRGEVMGLVGESGCGKSTCARTIVRIYKPQSGRIVIDGIDFSVRKERELHPLRRKVQMVFQDPYSSMNARMTVRDIVAEPLIAHRLCGSKGEIDDAAARMLEAVGLSRVHLDRYPHEFSGGQRQRICIARALVMKPEMIICDEPISALDVSIQAQIVNMLLDFKELYGLTYLFIAHDLSMVRYISDVVGVMYLGRLVEVCPAGEIYSHPLHPYTQGLLRAVPIPKRGAAKNERSIEGSIPSSTHPPPGCRFHTRCRHRMKRCEEESPVLTSLGGKRSVACHLY
ncbi:MAG: ATP-binding cassette domain-containing protein [Synergistaceae bacterium]|jgi:oligopeptide transport system ATP-binding protein|nr:ATP-binding cassette domain-containing protein [Synergistaceae bacterium]